MWESLGVQSVISFPFEGHETEVQRTRQFPGRPKPGQRQNQDRVPSLCPGLLCLKPHVRTRGLHTSVPCHSCALDSAKETHAWQAAASPHRDLGKIQIQGVLFPAFIIARAAVQAWPVLSTPKDCFRFRNARNSVYTFMDAIPQGLFAGVGEGGSLGSEGAEATGAGADGQHFCRAQSDGMSLKAKWQCGAHFPGTANAGSECPLCSWGVFPQPRGHRLRAVCLGSVRLSRTYLGRKCATDK